VTLQVKQAAVHLIADHDDLLGERERFPPLGRKAGVLARGAHSGSPRPIKFDTIATMRRSTSTTSFTVSPNQHVVTMAGARSSAMRASLALLRQSSDSLGERAIVYNSGPLSNQE
jgi:hypothetical protein